MRKYRPKAKGARYHHGDLRNKLVATAVAIIETEGAEALTLRSVAKRLGVSQTAPYRHFDSKELLLAAVGAQGFGSMLEQIRQRLEVTGPDPKKRYIEVGVAYLNFALTHRAHFRVMYANRSAEFSEGPVADAGRNAFKLFVETVVACQRAGAARTGDPSEIAIEAWAYVHGLISLHLEGLLPQRMRDDAVTQLVRRMSVFLGPT